MRHAGVPGQGRSAAKYDGRVQRYFLYSRRWQIWSGAPSGFRDIPLGIREILRRLIGCERELGPAETSQLLASATDADCADRFDRCSHQTPRWREVDSNPRSLSQRSRVFGLSPAPRRTAKALAAVPALPHSERRLLPHRGFLWWYRLLPGGRLRRRRIEGIFNGLACVESHSLAGRDFDALPGSWIPPLACGPPRHIPLRVGGGGAHSIHRVLEGCLREPFTTVMFGLVVCLIPRKPF